MARRITLSRRPVAAVNRRGAADPYVPPCLRAFVPFSNSLLATRYSQLAPAAFRPTLNP